MAQEIKYTKIFINNEWHDSLLGRTFETINPANEAKLADIQEAGEADVDKAVQAARAAFQDDSPWRQMDASQRGSLIFRLADLIQQNIDQLSRLEALDSGKPLSDAVVDVEFAIKTFRYYAGWSDKIHGKVIPADGGPGTFAYTRMEPVGVCGQIIPWNYPLLMLAWKFAPALAAGCTVVLKPSEFTPLTALFVANLTVEAGFPPGVINIVPGYGPVAGASLVRHPGVDKIAFTGSTAVGKQIQASAAQTTKRVSLELGGKSPLVVTESAGNDIRSAAQIAHDACFANMGQCCCAGTRTFVHESIYDQFVKEAVIVANNRSVGDPFASGITQGPQINAQQRDKILNLIESGKLEGARCVTGGAKIPGPGYFIQPTVFADVTDEMRIAREEIFGPVQQILKYRTMDEVIRRCNATDYGLAAGILTRDIDQANRFARQVRAGSIWINCYDPGTIQTPFGGFKQSGIGRELGEDGLHGYCEIKTVVVKQNLDVQQQ